MSIPPDLLSKNVGHDADFCTIWKQPDATVTVFINKNHFRKLVEWLRRVEREVMKNLEETSILVKTKKFLKHRKMNNAPTQILYAAKDFTGVSCLATNKLISL